MSTPFPHSSSPKNEKGQKYYQMKKTNLDLSKKRFIRIIVIREWDYHNKVRVFARGRKVKYGLLLSD